MCGINGIINYKNQVIEDEIHQMNSLLDHRGPDGRGVFKYENLFLGHTRLAIQDLSDKGAQPMSNDDRYWIVFNGEIYNYKSIKEELIYKGYKFFSQTDTEVILNSYKEWGEKCFHKFNGMWSLAIFDKISKELTICRDRYGVKPLYFFSSSSKFIFSSEIKPILSITNANLDINTILLDEQKKDGFCVTDYKNILILNPGHFIKINIDSGTKDKKRWWNGLENLTKVSPNRHKIIYEIKEKLSKSISLRLISDVKISTSLSGGIDSSIIFSELCNINNDITDLNPFILNYKGNLTFDFARNFSALKGKKAFIVNYDERATIENIVESYAIIEKTQYYPKQIKLYKAQSQKGFKVSIDGHGADECLGGYTDNIKHFSIDFHNNLKNSFEAIKNIKPESYVSILKNNYLTDLKGFIDPSLEREVGINFNESHYMDSEELEFENKAFYDDINNLKNYDISTQSLYLKATYGRLQWLLNKWDKASMKSSIEIRSPFLDWNFFQFALSIPSYHKVLNGQNKSLLREGYKDSVPNEILTYKNKQGLGNISNKEVRELIFQNSINEKAFKENSLWDYKQIYRDIKEKKLSKNKIIEINKIMKSFLFDQEMKRKCLL